VALNLIATGGQSEPAKSRAARAGCCGLKTGFSVQLRQHERLPGRWRSVSADEFYEPDYRIMRRRIRQS